ncbi:hypothetical protein AYB33_16760 [Leptospira santarosai]|nr:hypothetical protein AYB33_16760 [Leptospira santarosai]
MRHIIERAVALSLSQDLRYKKPFIDSFINNITTIDHFVVLNETAASEFFTAIIGRTDVTLYPYFFKALIHKLQLFTEGPNYGSQQLYVNRIRMLSILLINKSGKSIQDPNWSLESLATLQPLLCFIGFIDATTWPYLSDRVAQMLLQYALKYKNKVLNMNFPFSIIFEIERKNLLNAYQKSEFRKVIAKANFTTTIDLGFPKYISVKKCIKILHFNQFNEVKTVIHFLRTLKKEDYYQFPKRLQYNLGEAISHSAHGNSWEAQSFLSKIFNNEITDSSPFVFGIFCERVFNFKNQYDLKEKDLEETLNLILQNNILLGEIIELLKHKIFKLRNQPDNERKVRSLDGLLTLMENEHHFPKSCKETISMFRDEAMKYTSKQ